MNQQEFRSMRNVSGVALLEALVSILIFAIGILAIVGLQAASIKNAGESKFRADASFLANELIGEMWAEDRTAATLSTNFSSPNGAIYTTWKDSIIARDKLPGVAANPPTVVVTTIPGGSASDLPSSFVTITLYWKAPNDPPTAPAHQYTSVTQIH